MVESEQVSPSLGLRQAKVDAGLCAARSPTLSQLRMQGGAWGNEPEKAKASLELMQIRYPDVQTQSERSKISSRVSFLMTAPAYPSPHHRYTSSSFNSGQPPPLALVYLCGVVCMETTDFRR